MIADLLRETLVAVVRAMADAQSRWWIIGSAAARLHGAAVSIADVDVLADEADARVALDRLGVTATFDGGDALFRSAVFGRHVETPLPIEIMAGFAVRGADRFAPVLPTTRVFIDRGDLCLPVPDRTELAALLRRFGRLKDLARADLLDADDLPASPGDHSC